MKTKLFIWWSAVWVLGMGSLGCKVTSEKIQTWKQTVNGASKIRAALRDPGLEPALRIEAGEALADLSLSAQLVEDLNSLAPAQRAQVADGIVQRLMAKMEGSNPKATTRVQINAKDALFALRRVVPDAQRPAVDGRLVRWLLGDWQQRGAGEHSAEKIVGDLGRAAGDVLAAQIGTGTIPLVTSATLLREVGSQSARDLAAGKIIALASREKPAREPTFHALGKVGSHKAVQYLEEQAKSGPLEQRVWALRALALSPDPSVIPTMQALAGDATLKGEKALLRDEAFTVLEKIDDPRSLDALVRFLADPVETVRYRAAEAVLAGFKAKGLTKLLEALPSRYTYAREDLGDFIEKDIRELGPSVLPVLRQALGSRSWVARLIAVRMLGQMGTKQDVAALERLVGDKTKLKGWQGGATLGTEAAAAIKALRSR